MSQTIEEALKALSEFEDGLDRIKGETMEAKQRLLKMVSERAEASKKRVIAAGQRVAEAQLAAARQAAEREASAIRKKGEASTETLKKAISKRKGNAVEAVVRTLLGE